MNQETSAGTPRPGEQWLDLKEIDVSCISAHDPQLVRLADAIAQRVGQQRFHVWFNNSTRLDLKQDGLEIAVPNDFISEWIGLHFTRPIQEAAHEVLQTAPDARSHVKRMLNERYGNIDYHTMFWALAHADEPREGMSAFMEKRPPSWVPPDLT